MQSIGLSTPVRFRGIALTASSDQMEDRINIADDTHLTIKPSADGRGYQLSTDDATYAGHFSQAYTSLQVHRVDGKSRLNVENRDVVVQDVGPRALIYAKKGAMVTLQKGKLTGGQIKADMKSSVMIAPEECGQESSIPANVTIQQAETNPYFAQIYQFNRMADMMGLSEPVRKVLTTPYREYSVQIPVVMDNGELRTFYGYRIQHNGALGPYKGGIRYAPEVNLDEVRSLASAMTWKNSLAGLNYGGAKGGVICDPRELSKRELKALTEGYTKQISYIIGPDRDIPAPDMGTNAETMAWIMETFSEKYGNSPGVVTGKPVDPYGSVGRTEATGQGAFYVLDQLLRDRGSEMKDMTIAIQGFGNVGYHFAKFSSEAGAKIHAVSTIDGALYNPNGLDIEDLKTYLDDETHGEDLEQYAQEKADGTQVISNEDLLKLDVDVLVPAAAGEVITGKNAHEIKADIILECANHPTTPMADEILDKSGKIVVPDILVNAGGVIVSYFEWEQNKQGSKWKLDRINTQLKEKMVDNYVKVRDYAADKKLSYRDASWMLGIARVAKASKFTRDHLPKNFARTY